MRLRAIPTGMLKPTFVVLISILAACTGGAMDDKPFVRDLEIRVQTLKAGQELTMTSLNDDRWDSLFLFGPYTPLSNIEKAIKSKAPLAVVKARISERDDVNLLIFMDGGKVQLVVLVPRRIVDFSIPKATQPISRDKAVFRKSDSSAFLVWTGKE